jgi:hypothetical protein
MSLAFSPDALASIKRNPADARNLFLTKLGLGTDGFPASEKKRKKVRQRRAVLLDEAKSNGDTIKGDNQIILKSLLAIFNSSDPAEASARAPKLDDSRRVTSFFNNEIDIQLSAAGIKLPKITSKQLETTRVAMAKSILNATAVRTPRTGPTPPVEEPVFSSDDSTVRDLTFGGVSPIAPVSEPTATSTGDLVLEQMQTSMARASDLTERAATAVQSSAEATTRLQATVEETTRALTVLASAKSSSDGASPALSQQILAQLQGDPSLLKLARDGLLKWEDIVHDNPAEGAAGHVSGVEVGAPVLIPAKLQTLYDNLATVQRRENASLAGAVEVSYAARTTAGFRPSSAGYYGDRQVWMPIRAPPPTLPGRR